VKSAADLEAAMAVVRGRHYQVEETDAAVIELPRRPFSEIFHTFLGWGEGLMIFLEESELIADMIGILERALVGLEEDLARLPWTIALSPDNLDAQFMAPASFEEHLAPSYQRTSRLLHASEKLLVVHGGGPLRSLLRGLAACGVDCVQGICGAPQSDASLAEARSVCGPGMALWGGVPQDSLLAATSASEFRTAASLAFADAARDLAAIVGVSDKVPVEALPERLEELARMAGG
jgi:hypothetical protein